MSSTSDLVNDSVPDLTKNDVEETFWQKNFKEKTSHIRQLITVEPLVTAYIMSSVLCRTALINLELEKACRVNLNYNDTVCDAILSGEEHNFTKEYDGVQFVVSNMHSWQQPVESVIPLILVLFLGSYSDRHKWRKPLLLFPIIGDLFAVIGCALCVLFMKTWPIEAQGVAQTVVPSFTGGQVMMVMAVFAYIADVSTLEMRTLRIGIVQISINVCASIVQLVSGILLVHIGYYGVFLIATGFYIFAFTYGVFCIKEPKQPIKDTTQKGLLCDVFDPKHAIDTFNLILKKNPENNRTYIFLVLLTIFIYSGVLSGESSCFYLYVKSQLNWNIVDLTYLSTVNTVVHLIGTSVGLPFFTKVLNLSDPIILVVTLADKIICNFILGFANTSGLIYAGTIVSFLTGVTAVGIRSLATKIISENDLGKAQSLFSIFEAIAPAVSTPIYGSVIYNNTLRTFPAAFFFFGIILYVLCCVVIMWTYVHQKRKQIKIEREQKTNGVPDKNIPMESYVQTTHI